MSEPHAGDQPAGSAPSPASQPPASSPPPDQDALSGRKFMRWNLVAFLLGLLALGAGLLALRGRAEGREGAPDAGGGEASDAGALLFQPRWDDGRAEVARYAAWRTIYGQERPYELVRVAVKEPFDPAARVKPDAARPGIPGGASGPGVVDAIKTVAAHRIGVPPKPYEYRMSLVVRVPRRAPDRLLDASMSSQEWCGNTFVLVRGALPALPWRREVRGYFDGQADREDGLPEGTILEDQLPLLVRTLDLSGGPREVTLLPTLLGNKAPDARPYPARIYRARADVLVEVPAGRFRADELVVQATDGTTPAERPVPRYLVACTGARALLRYEDGTGRGELTSLERSAYWSEGGR